MKNNVIFFIIFCFTPTKWNGIYICGKRLDAQTENLINFLSLFSCYSFLCAINDLKQRKASGEKGTNHHNKHNSNRIHCEIVMEVCQEINKIIFSLWEWNKIEKIEAKHFLGKIQKQQQQKSNNNNWNILNKWKITTKNEKPLNATQKEKKQKKNRKISLGNECSRSSSSRNQMTMNKNGIIYIFFLFDKLPLLYCSFIYFFYFLCPNLPEKKMVILENTPAKKKEKLKEWLSNPEERTTEKKGKRKRDFSWQ